VALGTKPENRFKSDGFLYEKMYSKSDNNKYTIKNKYIAIFI
jgi:hypothetical protein